jgi:hypothetical protein
MNLTQWLLVKLAEEANEMGKEALKGSQFGLDSDFQGTTNAELITKEYNDLRAVIGFGTLLNNQSHFAKLFSDLPDAVFWPRAYKLSHYALQSHRIGLLTLSEEQLRQLEGYAKQHPVS